MGSSSSATAAGKPVLLARRGDELFAIDGKCTHYGASLADGLMVGDTVRCPWHHACFSLRTGEPRSPPALNAAAVWNVERRNGTAFVTGVRNDSGSKAAADRASPATTPRSVLIVGGGAAGDAAAQHLRRLGYEHPITIVSGDADGPVDRPNLSKDYLAGTAQEEWIPLRPAEYYGEHDIRLVTGRRAVAIDVAGKRVTFDDGGTVEFGALLLATGAAPITLPETLAPPGRVHYLRSLADSRAIIAASAGTDRAVVLGASFIALEVAASLRKRDLEVHVVAPDERPLERIMGAELGDFIQRVHESHGAIFHLQRTAERIDSAGVTLSDGARIDAGLIVAGIGVRPEDGLAARSGLTVDRGIVVDRYLQTSTPGIFAAGDVARYPDPRSGDLMRVEHWVVAQRQGQTAALNILGHKAPYTAPPFFWSQHYDLTINYVGHAAAWDDVDITGNLDERDFVATYRSGGRTVAVASAGRDTASLEAELAMEREVAAAGR